jgi:hypothetical protein
MNGVRTNMKNLVACCCEAPEGVSVGTMGREEENNPRSTRKLTEAKVLLQVSVDELHQTLRTDEMH